MPTPVGHTLAGIFASRFSKTRQARELLLQTILCVTMSNFADLDFLPGLLFNRPAEFHSSFTHSLAFALAVSLVAAALYLALCRRLPTRTRKSGDIKRPEGRPGDFGEIFSLALLAYGTHLALDMLQPDGRAPFGIPLFWPFSEATYRFPVPVFLGVVHPGGTATTVLDFMRGVLVWRNLAAILVEALILAPLVVLAQLWRRYKDYRNVGSGYAPDYRRAPDHRRAQDCRRAPDAGEQ